MKSSENYRWGEIYYADLDPIIGSEQGGIRPVLIIQNDAGNAFSPTLIVAPLTSRVNSKRIQPTHYLIPESCDLPRPSIVLLE